jgi:N-acetylmuramoyl-L-alanine amidase
MKSGSARHTLSVLFSLIIILCIAAPAKAGATAASLYQEANKGYVELSRDTALRKNKAGWIKVIKQFDAIVKKYPKSAQAPKSLIMEGKLYEQVYGYFWKKSDLNAALMAFGAVVDKYPDSLVADDALFRQAKLYETKLKDKKKAIELYRQIVTRYPKSDMAQQAREELNAINIKDDASAQKTEIKKTAKSDKKASSDSLKEAGPVEPKEDKEEQAPASIVHVKDIRQWSDSDYTRFVIELDGDAPFKTFSLPPNEEAARPQRIVMDVMSARLSKGIPLKADLNDALLKTMHVSQNTKDKVRIVLDLSSKADYKAFPMENPSRIILDIRSGPDTPVTVLCDPKDIKKLSPQSETEFHKVKKYAPSKVPENAPSLPKQLSLKVSTIVVDAGHGGKDPGGLGPNGEKEKDINLAVAKQLAKRLKDQGYEVLLTRDTDVFIPLEERTAFANRKKADLFISVHVNAHDNSDIKGIETYFLNLTTDASAIRVAARENATTTKSISDLQFIINDLMLTSKINESSRFASSTQKSIIGSLDKNEILTKDHGVKQAPFYVLIGAKMPAILVEIGFITNPNECELLHSEEYQQSIVDGIVTGINTYVSNTCYALKDKDREKTQ